MMNEAVVIPEISDTQEDLIRYVHRDSLSSCRRDIVQRIIGAAGPFKEGDLTIGASAAADDDQTRRNAQILLSRTRIDDMLALLRECVHQDNVTLAIESSLERTAADSVARWTVGELVAYLLDESTEGCAIASLAKGLHSDVIAACVKLMSDDDLRAVGAKVYNPLPRSKIGSKGYFAARVQPNSATDNPVDIMWQVFNAWAFAVGDLMLGTNPVSSNPAQIWSVETMLRDIIDAFDLRDVLPWTVLAHIDDQNTVESMDKGSTRLFFQSLAGTDGANSVFGLSMEKMASFARKRKSEEYAFYFETGQGSEFTNGQAYGCDMATLESRKFGFIRALRGSMAAQNQGMEPWVVVNDVAGFIGPEVFCTPDQLARVLLEDIVMGKLHGLCMGVDVCATMHMSVSLADIRWAIRQIVPAGPSHMMALPTNIDPMLSYMTTSFIDHVMVRHEFGTRVNDPMWKFFCDDLQVIDQQGNPVPGKFGNPAWVYALYQKKKLRSDRSLEDLEAQGRRQMIETMNRGVYMADGYDDSPFEGPRLHTDLQKQIESQVQRSKRVLYAEFSDDFIQSIPNARVFCTSSKDRADYVLHAKTGEAFDATETQRLEALSQDRVDAQLLGFDVQIVVSDGLNACALMDDERKHLFPFLSRLQKLFAHHDLRVASETIVVRNGRVRAGYEIGRILLGERADAGAQGGVERSGFRKTLVHAIGERPGTEHDSFSVYLTTASPSSWARTDSEGKVDHHCTRVVSGISDTSFDPVSAAEEVCSIILSSLTTKHVV
eukprot:ANDGO_00096.mRNA.1 Ethanolamine ammonia-lyase heavy chain